MKSLYPFRDIIADNCQTIIESKKDYISCFRSIYVPTTNDPLILYKEIKSTLMEKYGVIPETLCKSIKKAASLSPKHLKFYVELFRLICRENFHRFKYKKPKYDEFNDIIYELRGDTYSIGDFSGQLQDFCSNEIFSIIGDDNIEAFKEYTIMHQDFDPSDTIYSGIVSQSAINYAAQCGSVNIFMFIVNNYNLEYDYQKLVNKSYIGNNPDIINYCMQHGEPSEKAMTNAIATFNIDNILQLQKDFEFCIEPHECSHFNNLEALMHAYDQCEERDLIFFVTFPIYELIEKLLPYFDQNEYDYYFKKAMYANTIDISKLFIKHFPRQLLTPQMLIDNLYDAIEMNSFEMVKFIVELNIGIVNMEYDRKYPIELAAKYGDFEICKYLLDNGAEILNANPIVSALKYNNEDIAKLFLDHGVIVRDRYLDKCPFGYANNVEMINLLIEKGFDFHEALNDSNKCLLKVIKRKNEKLALYIIEKGADVLAITKHYETALHLAVKSNLIEVAKVLIQKGVDVNFSSNANVMALHFAVERSYEMVKLLLENGADVTARGTADFVFQAKRANRPDIANLLISYGAKAKESYDHIDFLKELFPDSFGPCDECDWKSMDHQDKNGSTILSLFIMRHDLRKAKFFISELKCDVNIPPRYLPISLAVQIDNLELVSLLCENGADLNKADFQGYYPLDRAKSQEMRDYLIQHGSVKRKE